MPITVKVFDAKTFDPIEDAILEVRDSPEPNLGLHEEKSYLEVGDHY